MPVENVTPNRAWPFPYSTNLLSFDVGRLLAFMGMADEDMANAFSQIALRAPKHDPEFTGNVLAPTAEPGANDDRVATTSFVTSLFATFSPSEVDAAALTGTIADARLSFQVSAAARTLLDDNLISDMRVTLGVYSTTQVDAMLLGFSNRGKVRAATTANVNLAAPGAAVDGVALSNGDPFLAKNQTAPAENGVYQFNGAAAAATRLAGYDAYDKIAGSQITVEEGAANADTMWLCQSNRGGTLDTTAITWSKMSIAGELFATNNLADLANALTAFNNIKQSASTSYAGVVELADNTETRAGVDNGRAVTPAGLADTLGSRVAALNGAITPTLLTGNVDNWDPAGIATASVQRISADADYRQIRGIANGWAGRQLLLINIGSYVIYLADEQVSSLAVNRILTPGGAWTAIFPGQSCLVVYDGQSGRWRSFAASLEPASQSTQEAATALNRVVTSYYQHFHPSAAKCWGTTTGGGTPILQASYNVSSTVDTALGRLAVNMGTSFSTANWSGNATAVCLTNANRMVSLVSKTAGSVILESSSAATTLADPGVGWDWQFFGDQ